MVISLAKEPSGRLLKHVVRCYLRLSDNQRYFQNTSLIRRNILTHFILFFRACEALCQCLPDQLRDDTFADCLKDDKSAKHWLTLLFKNLDNMNTNGGQQGGQSVNPNPLNMNKNLAKLPGSIER